MSEQPTIHRSALREHIEKTRHPYWGKGGQANTPELTDQILTFLHEQGVRVVDDDWEPRPLDVADVPDCVDWPARFRAAANAAEKRGAAAGAAELRDFANKMFWAPPDVVEVIGRALLTGETP